MSDRDPTNAEALAAIAGIAMTARDLIERLDRLDFRATGETLDALHEHLAVAGGSALHLANRLGCESEVGRLVSEGQQRLKSFRACAGMGGRA